MDEEIITSTILGPCAREGGPCDWWKEQHKFCTGSHHLSPTQVVTCSCPCHKVESSEIRFTEVRFGHFLVIDGQANPPPCVCMYCEKSFASYADVPNEQCPGKKG